MIHLCSAFEGIERGRTTPLMTAAFDVDNQKFHCFDFSLKQTIKDAMKKRDQLLGLIADRDVMCLDAKAHYDCFPMTPKQCFEAMPTAHVEKLKNVEMKKFLIQCLLRMKKINPENWRKLHAGAAKVYAELQRNELIANGECHRAVYHSDTVSGRSRVTSFPLQTTAVDVHLKDSNRDWFIHLDWMSADLRAASLLSKDSTMQNTFLHSDPYTAMSKILRVDREECKKAMLQAIYSLSVGDEVLVCFQTFRDWMAKRVEDISRGIPVSTLLGRKFKKSQDNDKTVFNATIQGTVAHAMHASLRRVFDVLPANLFTELQDSMVLIASKNEVERVLSVAVPIMLRPFAGSLGENPVFPLRISIGRRWRKWQMYKEVRDEQTELKKNAEETKKKSES